MNLNAKITLLYLSVSVSLIAALVAISLFAFRNFSIASAEAHIKSAAEIVRVNLTESMINGTIDRRENFLRRLMEVQGLKVARVVRSPDVIAQFGNGLSEEHTVDPIEEQVIREAHPMFAVEETADDTAFRGTIPYIASGHGTPNCLQCHHVREGTVLGAVTLSISIAELKRNALITVAGIIAAVTMFSGIALLVIRRMIHPVSTTASEVEVAVQRGIDGDFKARVERRTDDEVGQIAGDMNRLLGFLDEGLTRIGSSVAQLTSRTPKPGENQLNATIDMVESLTRAARFKQAIEEDETRMEIYERLSASLQEDCHLAEFSLYEVHINKNLMTPMVVDGQLKAECRWCDPQILARNETCRARRTGHIVDATAQPGLCYAFHSPEEAGPRTHICIPIMQSGTVGNVLQLVAPPDRAEELQRLVPHIGVYLREAAPVLEAKRLMETLKESNLRDPMTGLNNRRFLEEYVETLLANIQRRRTSMAVLMLDLDYFKMVNDTYGHDAGDMVLKALARVMRQSVRASDLVIRYGGEEFMILLLDANADGALQVAENIRHGVEQMKIAVAGTVLQKTISIGVSDFPKDSDTFWQAVKFADVALYRAKESGRNRVVKFTQDMWEAGPDY